MATGRGLRRAVHGPPPGAAGRDGHPGARAGRVRHRVGREPPRFPPPLGTLVIEIVHSSRRTDLRVKARSHAAAAVPRFWVVDLAAGVVVVHTDPVPGDATAGTAMYGTVRRLPRDSELEVLGLAVRPSDLLAP
ncbi:MAG: Uma2 family endonuclease [Kineosporiaceae bacterium]